MSATGVVRRVITLTSVTASDTAATVDVAGTVIMTAVALMTFAWKERTVRFTWVILNLTEASAPLSSTTNGLLLTLTRG